MTPAEYCREIETYLCRKNEGHLIRIAGPAFEQVCGWAKQGVPLKVAFQGIDRYCERYYAKGPRRRPVRIEFCEADILELFDDWRRAVGVGRSASRDTSDGPAPRKPALASHIERAIARLTSVRGGGRTAGFDEVIASAVRKLDTLGAEGRNARGEARARVLEQLATVDREVMHAATSALDSHTARTLRDEAQAELAPFGARMSPEAREQALAAAFERLARESLGLPIIKYE